MKSSRRRAGSSNRRSLGEGGSSRRSAPKRQLATAAALPGLQTPAEKLRQLINTIPDDASQSFLPVGQHEFTQCSNALAKFADRAEGGPPLPFPSALLPPPL